MKDIVRIALVTGCAVFAACLGVLGCFNKGEEPGGPTQHFATMEQMQPYVKPYDHAYILTGSPVETVVEMEKDPGEVVLKFLSFDKVVEEEHYVYDDRVFGFAGYEDEGFDPPITLLKFPFTVGDGWEWSGKYEYVSDRDAKAEVKTSGERLTTVAGDFDTVRVDVALSIDSGGPDPVAHRLTFWFAPKRGVVRREIENGMTREPMPPKQTSQTP